MITLVVENFPMICVVLVGGILIGIFAKFLFNAIGALSEFKEISERAKRDAEIIKRESESVMPLARKMNEMCQSLGGDLWKIEKYDDLTAAVEHLEREVKKINYMIERPKQGK